MSSMEDLHDRNSLADPRFDEPRSDQTPPSTDQLDLLQCVLEQSIERWCEDNDPLPIDLKPLVAIARRHLDAPLCLDPIAIELIQTVLVEALGWRHPKSKQWQPIARLLAQTLMTDRNSRARMERLWQRLQTAVTCSGRERA